MKSPNRAFTPDLPEALRSLRKFADFDIENVICFHGGLVQGDVQHQFAALTA
ncbi:hypothetical protein GZH47_00740 [Paenibacillus rhizovicinus]|uniref:MBL fold metallo-hydrolase n=1 Tax=Paenibacillus rhizovicinus TaxID=2704463 RepID=A0A6C0NTH8_9BACL|nr:hypothetical protein [Paenibacillus rhizovicinus]QHW29504.1 hypothetical protein GZH47_00740 [Paenibacillus rhizovicinus]